MPLHMVAEDLASGRLARIHPQREPGDQPYQIPMVLMYRLARPPGPALRWFLDRLWP